MTVTVPHWGFRPRRSLEDNQHEKSIDRHFLSFLFTTTKHSDDSLVGTVLAVYGLLANDPLASKHPAACLACKYHLQWYQQLQIRGLQASSTG